MRQALATGTRGARLGRAALLVLALQAWKAWLLLKVWLIAEGTGPIPLLGRIRMLPSHPDWVLSALAQSAVTALVMVGLARYWRTVWTLLAAAVAGGVAWALTSGLLPGGLAGAFLVLQSLQEISATALVLASVAVAWRCGRWAAVPVVALVGGAAAGASRLVFTNTLWGAPWPEGWLRALADEAVGVALLAVVVAVLRGTTTATPDRAPGGALVGTLGLLALTAAHLVAGRIYSGWSAADSLRLLIAGAALAVLTSVALVGSLRGASPAHPR